jgi:AAA domain, putative AbiEii toxin, Type IV TA system
VRITAIAAENFLSFRRLDFSDVPASLAVVVGPNGAGKSNLTRAIELVGRSLAFADDTRCANFGRYLDARNVNAPAREPMTVRLGIELDQPHERLLIRDFLRSFVASLVLAPASRFGGVVSATDVEKWASSQITDETVTPMCRGTVVASRVGLPGTEEWSIGYEFLVDDRRVSWSFRGPLSDTVGAGLLEASDRVSGYGSLLERLQPPPYSSPASLDLGSFSLQLFLPDGKHSRVSGRPEALSVDQTVESLATLAEALEVPIPQGNSIPLATVMHYIFRRSVVLVPGQRPAPRRFFPGVATREAQSPEDLGALPLELHRLQGGTQVDQQRFRRIQRRFRELADRRVTIQSQPSRRQPPEFDDEREIEPHVSEGSRDVPLEFAGAGLWEALVLAYATTADDSAVVVLDEPAQNLHPSLQRRVLDDLLRRPGQSLLITHSPYLIPTHARNDLARVARVERTTGESRIRRLAPTQLGQREEREQEGQLWQLFLGSTDTRGLLFAAGVVLCEGGTEVGILEQWLNATPDGNTPADKNVVFFDVGGDQRFGFYCRYLNAFGIPWAVVCDSKVMNPVKPQSIHNQLQIRTQSRRKPEGPTISKAALARQRKRLERFGVFTLVKQPEFEIETYLEPLDPALWRKAGKSEGQNKIRRARVFASTVPCPKEVSELWRKVGNHLGVATAPSSV